MRIRNAVIVIIFVVLLAYQVADPMVASAQFGYYETVDFSKYPDNTPASAINDPYVRFSVNGGARIIQGRLEIDPGTTLLITLAAPSKLTTFDQRLEGACEGLYATEQTLKDGKVSAERPHGPDICVDPGVKIATETFTDEHDALRISLGGTKGNLVHLYIANFRVGFATKPTTQVAANVATPMPIPTATPGNVISTKTTATTVKVGDSALVNNFDAGPIDLLNSADPKGIVQAKLPGSIVVTITNGPIKYNGLVWWHIRTVDWDQGWIVTSINVNGSPVPTLLPNSTAVIQGLLDQSRSQNDAAGMLKLALALRAEQEYDQAQATLESALKLNPNDAEVYFYLGSLFNDVGKVFGQTGYQEAIDPFNHAISLDATQYLYFLGRGEAYNSQAKYAEALADYKQATVLNPNSATAFNNLGVVESEMNDNASALTDFNQSIKLDSYNAPAYRNRGILYDDQNKSSSAEADFKQAIKVEPTDLAAYRSLALFYYTGGDSTRALVLCNAAIKINAQDGLGYLCRGSIYLDQGNLDSAQTDLELALKLAPSNEAVYFELAALYYNQGDDNHAIQEANVVVSLDPFDPQAYYNLGLISADMGRYGDADTAYKQAIALNPNFIDARINRCSLNAQQQKIQEALDDCNYVLKLDPNNVYALSNRAFAYSFDPKTYTLAIADLKHVLQLDPTNADAYELLGHIYVQQKDYADAKAAYNSYLKLTKTPDSQATQDIAIINNNFSSVPTPVR